MQIVQGTLFTHLATIWSTKGHLFPETHTCSLQMPPYIYSSAAFFLKLILAHCGANHLKGQCHKKSTLHQLRSYLTVYSQDQCSRHSIISKRFMPQNSYLLAVDPIILRGNATKVSITSTQIISSSISMNIHVGVIWLSQCCLLPETHTCSLWVQSLWGAMPHSRPYTKGNHIW